MRAGPPAPFGAQLRSLREAAGFTQEELATIAGLSVHAVSALERGQRRRPHPETVRALSTALDLPATIRDALLRAARTSSRDVTVAASDAAVLPHVVTPLVGREADVRTLKRWLADPSARIITLVGTGGAGKTRLALEVARDVAAARTMRVVFVGLASIRDPVFVASAIAEAFGSADVADLPRRVRAACEGDPVLLVIDNCEHVLDAVPLIGSLLAAAASLRVLATSRAPLRLRGEREYAVGPLAVEVNRRAESPDQGALAPAIRVFVDRVHDVDREFQLTETSAPIVAAICRRLDALPLALELAAPWLKVLSPAELLQRLEHDVLSPAVGRRDLPERQQTMNATVAWSYQLLSADEQRAFRRLGILPGRFPIDAVAAVLFEDRGHATADDSLRAVAGLIERSLLVREQSAAGPRLYYMLETVRAYAAAELTASGERDAAMQGLVRYCVAAAAAAAANLSGYAQGEWLERVRDDLESIRSALVWLIEHGRPAEASDIAWHLLFFWLIGGHAAEGLRWYEQVANLESIPPSTRAQALAGAAIMWYALGDLDRARDAGELCLTVSADALTAPAAVAENILGYIELGGGDFRAARDRFRRSRERFDQLGIVWGAGNALAGMGWAALAAADFDEADRLAGEATAALSNVGPWFSLVVLYVRAVLAVRRDKPVEAIAFVRESLARISALHDKFAFVYALVPLAAAAELQGDDAWAAKILGARDAVTERTGAIVVDHSVRDLRERAERDARARLDQRRWAREYEAGRNASVESLLKEIDDREPGQPNVRRRNDRRDVIGRSNL